MRFWGLAKRNFIEIILDPLSSMLGVLFPSLLLILFVAINKSSNLPIDMFKVENVVPGIIVLGFAMLMMFSAMLIAKDRQTSLLARLQTLPLKPIDFILGYSLPFVPVALLQMIFIFAIGFLFGLQFTWGILLSVLILLVIALIMISIGVILGILCSENQISGIGTILINVFTLFSGAWFDLNFMGGFVKMFGYSMPFAHGVDAVRELLTNSAFDYTHLIFIFGYALLLGAASVFIFYKKLKGKSVHATIKPKN